MDYNLLCKILMKWSLENKEYELTSKRSIGIV